MRSTTWNTLSTTVQPWINARFIPALPCLQGGWESWIQTDFVAHLNQVGGLNPAMMFDIERESPIPYNNGGRCDWLINHYTADAIHPRIVVEIKAQSVTITGAAFLAGVRADIDQLAARNLTPAFAHSTRIMLAFAIHPDVVAALTHYDGMVEFASVVGAVAVLGRTVVG